MSDWDQDPELAKVPPGLPDAPPDPRCAVRTAALRPEALQALKNYIQADADGVMVCVSRQALDEAIAVLGAAQAVPDPVQDTYLVGGPDLKAMSGSVESDRIIQLHFKRRATDADRKWLLEAINTKIAADGVAMPSAHRGGET